MSSRRAWLAHSAAWGAGVLAGCRPGEAPGPVPLAEADLPPSRWVGQRPERGHRLRTGAALGPLGASVQRRVDVLVIGAGVAGLAAARALRRAGIEDIAVLESEPVPGGNSRAHRMAGLACPMGAHYLPLPGAAAPEVQALLGELGLARWFHGRWVYDERHLCHSPQERLFVDGAWHEGLLPPLAAGSRAETQVRRFAAAVRGAQRELGFAMPTLRAPWTAAHDRLDAQRFDAWLDAQGLDDARLRLHLDYCCRDDYGAGIDTVSAWAGLHYFASRHGFAAPGDEEEAEREPVLTWPEGNAWLVARLVADLGGCVHTDRMALALRTGRHAVSAWVRHEAGAVIEQWTARQVVLAVPLFVAARLWDAAPAALGEAVQVVRHAPWLVANLQLDGPLLDRVGAPAAWDNVVAGARSLGYVDAMHQQLRPHTGPTVLSAYWALGAGERAGLLGADPRAWARRVLEEWLPVHPDLVRRVQAIDLARWGHAMAVPAPGVRGHRALAQLGAAAQSARRGERVRIAHADLAGYSVFEEAYTRGWTSGAQVARALRA